MVNPIHVILEIIFSQNLKTLLHYLLASSVTVWKSISILIPDLINEIFFSPGRILGSFFDPYCSDI